MSSCPYRVWTLLPLETRRRLRVVHASRGGEWPDPRPPVSPERIAHLADSPRCTCVREVAA